MKKQATDLEKTIAKYIYNKGIISKIYKDFLKFSIMKMSKPNKKIVIRSEPTPYKR